MITEHLGDKFSKKEVIAKAQRIMDKSSMGMAGKDSFTPGKDKIIKQRKADKEDDDGWNEEQ